MNDYQIGDLAQQQYALWQTQQSIVSGSIDLLMLMIFGYFIAAVFIGPKLTKGQNRLFSAAYVAWAAYESLQLYVSINVAKTVALKFVEIAPESVPKPFYDYYMGGSIENVYYSLIFLTLLGSLYFMWSIRHSSA